jgi:hypothetical protein
MPEGKLLAGQHLSADGSLGRAEQDLASIDERVCENENVPNPGKFPQGSTAGFTADEASVDASVSSFATG